MTTFDDWHESVWQRIYQILKEHVCEEEAAFLALELAAAIKTGDYSQFSKKMMFTTSGGLKVAVMLLWFPLTENYHRKH